MLTKYIQHLETFVKPGKASFYLDEIDDKSFHAFRQLLVLQKQGFIYIHRKENQIFFKQLALQHLANPKHFEQLLKMDVN